MNPYYEYYQIQSGTGSAQGNGRIGRVYAAGHQRGAGIGQVLSGLLRYALPLITRGVKAIGREAASSGFNLLSDIANEKPFGESARNRLAESGRNLKRKAEGKYNLRMEGGGTGQSGSRRGAKRLKREKKKEQRKKNKQKSREYNEETREEEEEEEERIFSRHLQLERKNVFTPGVVRGDEERVGYF